MVARICVSLAGEVRAAMDTIVKNYEKYFFPVLCEKQPMPELEAMPSYLPDTVVFQLYHDDGEAEFADYMDANSLTFVALGDAERLVLCGIDATARPHHEGGPTSTGVGSRNCLRHSPPSSVHSLRHVRTQSVVAPSVQHGKRQPQQ
ncbi:mitotic centromere-associated kinesin (MCAK) [Trypanosoma cruzi]|nr:mitotic centromere-associated kinesin (MCAK) [Trypanosoma cruzi]